MNKYMLTSKIFINHFGAIAFKHLGFTVLQEGYEYNPGHSVRIQKYNNYNEWLDHKTRLLLHGAKELKITEDYNCE